MVSVCQVGSVILLSNKQGDIVRILKVYSPLPCGAGSAVPREGFNLSVIILASLLVCPMLGCRHSLMRISNNFTFFSSGMHIFNHSYLCTLASRGTLPNVLALTSKYKSCSAETSSIC